MHGSQFLLAGIVLIILYKTIRSYLAKKISLLFTLCWAGFWITVLIAIFLPYWLDTLALNLGVNRGIDFAVYFSIIVLFYMIYRIYTHLMRIEQKITDIVRKEAIRKIN